MSKQKTISSSIELSGIGLHTGNQASVKLIPAPEDHGIVFKRTDLPDQPVIPADIDYVVGLERGTCIGKGDVSVFSTEHVMAALAGMEIDNAVIEVNTNEVPLCDGSAKPFVDVIKKSGIQEQTKSRNYLTLREPLLYEKGNVALSVFPSDRFHVTLMIDYQHPALGAQHTTMFGVSEFESEYAHARTFCFLSEVLKLRESGIIKGATLDSAIVVQDIENSPDLLATIAKLFNLKEVFWGENGFLNNTKLRYPNELCRHKALDLMGDLYLLGAPLKAHVLAARSGHAANIAMAKLIRKECNKQKAKSKQYDIQAILKLLPHRYPFLLVDRIVEMVPGKKIIAIKNVTINEPFFQGHFPGSPVMPGVLQVEALAQTGGLLALNSLQLKDGTPPIVYFMTIDAVKFRRPVVPGDQLRLEVEILKLKGRVCRFAGKTFVGDEIACEAELMATFGE